MVADRHERYFEELEEELDRALGVAERARERGDDPEPEVEIPVARDMADRVEKVLDIPGVADRVRAYENDPSVSREEAALELAKAFADGEVGDYDTPAGKVEGAVRTAVALLTEGVVAAPIEGIDRVEAMDNGDGTQCVRVFYAGPIRSAGGTAQALSVLVADYTRTLVGLAEYKPREEEVERYAEEVGLYDDDTGLQYSPKDKETKFIARNVPICLDGEATGDLEVSGYRDLERVGTNNPRGGMCLVLAEGIAQKAPKIQRYTDGLDEVEWPWLEDLVAGTVGETDGDEPADDTEAEAATEDTEDTEDGQGENADDGAAPAGPPRPEPSEKFLRDLIAGRPVFSHPSRSGGFRLRYGRARNHGFATAGVHPATMHLVDDFLATGTQIKTERPGKAAGVVPVDSIEGPTVRLANGDVRRIDDPEEALELRNGVDAVLDLGEYLVNYGEFVENNHPLAPASYTVEWWIQDAEAAGAPVQAWRDDPHVDPADPDAREALRWAREYDAPLHPKYTYLWHDIGVEQLDTLAGAVAGGRFAGGDGASVEGRSAEPGRTLVVPREEGVCEALEALLVEHSRGEETVTVPDAGPLVASLGLSEELERPWTLAELPASAREYDDGDNAVEAVNAVAPFELRERAPTRIGNRMGRPEKSEQRELKPAVHTLFPIGEAGGNQRDVAAAAGHTDGMRGAAGQLELSVARQRCAGCGTLTYKPRCPDCDGRTEAVYECQDCGREVDDPGPAADCPRCEGPVSAVQRTTVDVAGEYQDALSAVGVREREFPILKGVKGLTSARKLPEPMEKGVLRSKHGVSAFKDGTVRYDMTDLPVTAVRPAELDVTADQFRELGYERDVAGEPLRHDDQLVELRVQDIVLSDGAAEHMIKTADFVDDLLERYYGLAPFYELDDRDDLVGELVFGMAPHTSAAVVGRVVGFTSAAVGYAHPYFHAAKRRNCFHPETKLWFEDEDGTTRYGDIESFVEARLDEESAEQDDFGTLVTEFDDTESVPRVPSLRDDGTQSVQPVRAVSRHPAPDHMIRVTTESGRELTVTPDHPVHVQSSEGGGITDVEARELDGSDSLVTPRHLDSVSSGDAERRFDLLAEFLAEPSIDNDRLIVKELDKDRLYDLFAERLADDWDGQFYPLQSTADHLGLRKKRLSNYLYRESIPVSLLAELFGETSELLEWVPQDCRLGMKRDRTEIDRVVTLDEQVATLLGYYAAEGFAREQETPKGTIHQTTICGTEQEARQFFLETLADVFGVEPYEENHAKVIVSGRLLRTFFDTILDAGVHAHTKRVPDCIFDASDDVVSAYLSGYFSGDGAVGSSGRSVSSTTVSPELRTDLIALLTRLGIPAQVNRSDPVSVSERFPGFYTEDSGAKSRPSYNIHVSVSNVTDFAERIGFHLRRNDDALDTGVDDTQPASEPACCYDGGTESYLLDPIADIEYVASDTDYVYCLTVENTHSLVVDDLSSLQCDGDEDCVMLLMDGLLNFSKSYLPDKRGGSVAEDSRLIAVSPDGDVRFTTFGEFWKELDSQVVRDGKFRKKPCRAEGWQTYAFDDRHRASLQPIEKAIRYRAAEGETLQRVETQFGRSLDITADHSLFRYDDGIEEVAGADLEEGDLVVAPRELDIDPVETTVDVVEAVDEPYVFIDDRIEDLLRTVWESTDRGSAADDEFMRGLSYRLSKRKIGVERLSRILETGGLAGVPADVTVGVAGSESGIDRQIAVDEEFAWLLGLFVAEGTLSSVRPCIHNADEEVAERAVGIASDALGTEPETRWVNRSHEIRFPVVFEAVLHELGFVDADSYDPSEKLIPDCILRAPRPIVLSFLRGFIAGDGSEASDDTVTTVAFHTTSDDVRDGVLFLLHRLGLVGNVSTQTDRPGNRQEIHTVTVSGGATDNPLHRVLNGEEPYRPKSLVVTIPEALLELREMDIEGVKQLIPKDLLRRENVSLEKLQEMVEALEGRELSETAQERLTELRPLVDGDLSYLRVENVEEIDYEGYLYDLQVGGEPIFTADWLYAHNSMDAPLVMSSRIDPSEIDDEAHNMDIVEQYPREFYEATRRMADPGEAEIRIAEETLGTDNEYSGFRHTHDTGDIAAGPSLSAYKTLGDMTEKMNAQLELARTLRAVDETDVAERVIEYHFLPDIIGNLRAFSRQEVRCLDCGHKYRRAPLTGHCRECGADRMTLTVHEGSVSKYIDTATRVAEEYGCREYTRQRLQILERAIESVFQDDTNKQSGIADFM